MPPIRVYSLTFPALRQVRPRVEVQRRRESAIPLTSLKEGFDKLLTFSELSTLPLCPLLCCWTREAFAVRLTILS
jgi:hypothetical protein